MIARPAPATRALRRRTVCGGWQGSGLVESLAGPGANQTGTTWLSAGIAGKGLELLRQAVPGLTRLAALQRRLPTMGMGPRLVEAGGLLYYGADLDEAIARAVGFIDRILRGGRPAELPIEQPARLEFTVNQRTAQAIGLTLPAGLLLRATRVIA